jgi:hypothetical protein
VALISSTDVQALLEALGGGDTATLGGSTAPCIIGGADFAQLADAGTPVEVISKALLVTVQTGALAGLAAGATVTLRGGSYTVDRSLRHRNEALTVFLAYPQ